MQEKLKKTHKEELIGDLEKRLQKYRSICLFLMRFFSFRLKDEVSFKKANEIIKNNKNPVSFLDSPGVQTMEKSHYF